MNPTAVSPNARIKVIRKIGNCSPIRDVVTTPNEIAITPAPDASDPVRTTSQIRINSRLNAFTIFTLNIAQAHAK